MSLTNIAILVSGGGRSLENICEKIDDNHLTNVRVSVVISSKETAAAVNRAQRRDIPTRVLRKKDFETIDAYSDAISKVCDHYQVHLVILAGWLHFYRIPDRYIGKVLNIHPSLIPAFCGKGFYGHKVHKAVVCNKKKVNLLQKTVE